jgi:hypothetical protein
MRKHWAAGALACALIATLPSTLAAQTPAATPATAVDNLAQWGPYARLLGQTMQEQTAPRFRLHWRWDTPGEVLLEEWFRGTSDPDKPAYVMTIRLGPTPGTFNLKSSSLIGKEWQGTLQDDGSVRYVGTGMLKLTYIARLDEQGNFVQTTAKGRPYIHAFPIEPAPSAAVAATSPAPESVPAPTPAPTPAPVVAPVVGTAPPAPVVAKQAPSPPPPRLKTPRRLTDADLERIRLSVQKSRARSIEQTRQAELQRQEAARQAELQQLAWAAAEAQRQAEEAEADAEFEAERARKAAAWQQMAQANEQALADSMSRLQETTARVQAQQAEAAARQRAQAEAVQQAQRQRQVELVRAANQRQDAEAARLAAQRQQYEQQRANALAAESARQPSRSAAHDAGAGRASTDTDARRCVSSPEVRENDTFQGNTAAYVSNGCGTPVDVKICLKTESGWKCGVTWGLASQGSWSHSAFRATGPVFVDAKTAGSSRALAAPN